MNAKELMIGDWVFTRGNIEQVTSIYDGYICTEHYEDSHDYYFEPIPLTPEILEKNGFVETDAVVVGARKMIWESEGGRTEITIWMDDTMQMDIRKNIYYEDEVWYTLPFACTVHELQHALRLCGIDKEIVL